MFPEMFCSAKDCACRPVTAVVIASKIPIAASIALAAGRVEPDAPAAWAQQPSQAACHGERSAKTGTWAKRSRRALGRMRRRRQFLPRAGNPCRGYARSLWSAADLLSEGFMRFEGTSGYVATDDL